MSAPLALWLRVALRRCAVLAAWLCLLAAWACLPAAWLWPLIAAPALRAAEPAAETGSAATPSAETPLLEVEGGSDTVRGEPEEAQEAEDVVPPLLTDGLQPGTRVVIPRSKFAGSGKSVAEVLEEVPGVTVTRSGDALGGTRVSLRGAPAEQVLILVDGLPLYQGADNPGARRDEGRAGADLAAIPLDQVEQIEVLRGGASSLYGAGAAAGAVLITLRPPRKPRLEAALGAGSGGVRTVELRWVTPLGTDTARDTVADAVPNTVPDTVPNTVADSSAARGAGDLARVEQQPGTLGLQLTHRRSAGSYVYYDLGAVGGECALDLGGGYFERGCNRRSHTALTVDWTPRRTQRWRLELEAQNADGLGATENPRPYGQERRQRARLSYQDQAALAPDDAAAQDTLHWRGRLEAQSYRRQEVSTLPGAGLVGRFDETRGGAALWRERWLGLHRLKAGVDLEGHSLRDRAFEAGRQQAALHVAWEHHGQQSTTEANLRYDALSDQPGQTSYRLAFSRILVSPDSEAAIATTRGGGWGLKGSHGTGFRPPSLYELYDPGAVAGSSAANPALLAEHSTSVDLGPYFSAGESFHAEALLFRQEYRDQIVFSPGPGIFENVERSRSSGLEAALGWRPGHGFSLDAAYTRQHARILDTEDPRYWGNTVPGVPELHWNASLEWSRGEGTRSVRRVWLRARHSGRRFLTMANIQYLEPYSVLDTGGAVSLTPGWSAEASIHNLANRTYVELDNQPTPGRTLLLTLRWRRADAAD